MPCPTCGSPPQANFIHAWDAQAAGIALTRAIMAARTATPALLAPWRQECPDCGTTFDRYSPDHHAQDYIEPDCPHCFPPCADCDAQEDHRDDVRHALDDGRPLCESCFDDAHFTCANCGDATHDELRNETADGPVCDDCMHQDYSRCDSCGETAHHDNMRRDHNYTLCEGCYEDDYFTCDGCENILHNDDYHSDGYCQDCQREDEDDEGLAPHSADAATLGYFGPGAKHAHRPDPKTRYLGVELECEVSHDHAIGERADSLVGRLARIDGAGREFAIAKGDGSLSHGFEVNTAPATLDVQQKAWSHALGDTPRGVKSHDTSTCGLHVHVSRSSLSQLTIGKALVFVNDPRNGQFVTAIAGRDASHYCQRKPKKFGDARQYNPDRYEAVNLQNRHTIEFRIFKGTLKAETLLARLEFVSALLDWAPHASAATLTSRALIDWTRTRRKHYPNFAAWLSAKGLIPTPKSKPSTIQGTK